MLIPSIELMGGQIVQSVRGETQKLSLEDFDDWVEGLRKYPLVQIIDLDADLGADLDAGLDAGTQRGENRELIERVCKRLPCQAGGGLKTPEDGQRLLDAGAKRVIYGSSLFGAEGVNKAFAAELKKALGEEALCFSVDAKNGRVAMKGLKDSVDLTPEEAITWLEDYCAAFLYRHVDSEGTMQGFPIDVAAILRSTTARQLIVSGEIKEGAEVDALDAMGVDAAVRAAYSGAMEA